MEQKLIMVMAEVFAISSDKIDRSTTMDSVEEWDSLKHIELMTVLEEKFGIALEMEEMLEMTSFKAIKHVISTK